MTSEEKKKILIVTRGFYPMNSPRSFRATELVKEFAKQGHDVTVLIPWSDSTHAEFEQKFGVNIKSIGPLRWTRLSTTTNRTWLRFLKRGINRIFEVLFEFPDIEIMFKVRSALKSEYAYDLLVSIATPYPNHWGVAWAWNAEQPIAKTWIADCGDPFMGTTLDRFPRPFYFRYLEKNFCQKAHFISVPFSGAISGYYSEFHSKIRVIPQGVNFEKIKQILDDYVPNKVPTFAFAGSLSPGKRDPSKLLKYLTDSKRQFKFIIYTKNIDLVQPYLLPGNGRIELRDYIPRDQLLKVLSRMDFVVNINNASTTQMPSKLIDYYLTGRPVLNICSNDFDQEVFDQFLIGNYSGRYQYQNIDQYRIENVCQHFLNLHNIHGLL